jgi:hypothetical protein
MGLTAARNRNGKGDYVGQSEYAERKNNPYDTMAILEKPPANRAAAV